MMDAAVTSRGRERFRYEADLIAPLRPSLARMVFGHSVIDEVETFSEVPAVHGVPDLAAVRFDWDAVQTRTEHGIGTLTTDVEVRSVLALTGVRLSASELAKRLMMSADYVRRGVLPLLESQGWIEVHTDGLVSRSAHAVAVGRRVVTVEAKLRDWHGALGQARRQRYSADAAYIALDAASVPHIHEDLLHVAESGIGVITVDAATGRSIVLARPVRVLSPAQTLVGRFLIAERCLSMWTQGERSGQIYPVFGWTYPDVKPIT